MIINEYQIIFLKKRFHRYILMPKYHPPMKRFNWETPAAPPVLPIFLETAAVTVSDVAVVTLLSKPASVAVNAVTRGSCAVLMSKVPETSNALLITPPLCESWGWHRFCCSQPSSEECWLGRGSITGRRLPKNKTAQVKKQH